MWEVFDQLAGGSRRREQCFDTWQIYRNHLFSYGDDDDGDDGDWDDGDDDDDDDNDHHHDNDDDDDDAPAKPCVAS